MNKQQTFRHTFLALALAALGTTGTALAVDEVEPNDASPQMLEMGTGGIVEVFGSIGSATGDPVVPDTDFYSFRANKNDIIDIDIDGGVGGLGHINTLLTLFGPTGEWLTENDETTTGDPGSMSFSDARIDRYFIRVTGIYTVAVTGAPAAFVQYGTRADYRERTPESNGDYKLTIVGLTAPVPSVQYISIDVKPGSKEFTPVNPKAHGVVPVALLSGDGFTAPVDVKQSSLTFGATGDEASLARCSKEGKDVDGDGLPDLVCHFEIQAANFSPQHTVGILKGTTNGGTAIEGRALLKVVPVKRKK